MRAVDPKIRLIAVGDNDMNWNRTVLRLAGQHIDYLAVHHYYSRKAMGDDPLNLMAHPLHYEAIYRDLERAIGELVPGRRIGLAINEWGLDLATQDQYSMLAALYGARLLNVFERSSDLIAMSAVSDLVNGWPGGIIQASRDAVFVTPLYLVNALYREHQGDESLTTEVTGPVFDSSREGKSVPYVDAVASRSADGRKLFVKAVNTNLRSPLTVSLHVRGAKLAPRGRIATIRENSPGAANSFLAPEAITIHRSELDVHEPLTVELPAGSIVAIRLETAR
jgi:alpha-N-arabinofuranosidase